METRERVRIKETIEEIISEEEPITPEEYDVILFNDAITPVPVVILVLIDVFGLRGDHAMNIIFTAETNGEAVVGTYPFSTANEKVVKARNLSKSIGFDLKFEINEK